MSPAFRNALLWIVASATMVVACLSSASAAYVDDHYVPDNEDAFYHARRILDSVLTHAPVMQFDPKIHVPEGSWITWPWGFDTLMADITSAFGPFADVDAANRVLMNIPPVASIMAVLLVLVLARQVELPMLHAIVFALGFALSACGLSCLQCRQCRSPFRGAAVHARHIHGWRRRFSVTTTARRSRPWCWAVCSGSRSRCRTACSSCSCRCA